MAPNRKKSRAKANNDSGNRASVSGGASFSQRQQAPRDATSGAQKPQRGSIPTTATPNAQPKPSHVPSQPPAQSVWGRARNDNVLSGAAKGGPPQKGPVAAGQTPPSSAVSAASTTTTNASGATSPATVPDTHTPVKGFATREIKEFLKKAYQDATAGDNKRASKSYKTDDGSSKRASGAWAAKPHQMASGQDFWVQLAKQVAAREHSGG